MRQFWAISASLILFASLFLGCHKTAKKDDGDAQAVAPVDPNVKVVPPVIVKGGPKKKDSDAPSKPAVVDFSKQEKYETALANALMALAEQKYNDALASFETARSIQDNEFVQGEIAKLKLRMEQDGAAKKTVKNIETVLNDGKADDAAKLAKEALKEFGEGDDAAKLVELSVQAEALKNAESNEAKDARYARFKKEGNAALEEKNLRAAALAFEQALLARDDADLQKTYDDIRGKLDTYDAMRKKAAELRKDPLQIDDAIAALKEAKNAWDTLQVRQLIDEYQLAKASKRETVSVVDFEMRGDVGMANAGSALADELLPLLKPKYDLFERGQLRKIAGELQLGVGFADDPKQQALLGKVANVRYLVIGSVSRLAGVSVRARLVDVQTGLVVQTGRVLADSVEDALKQMPDLAQQLLMTDDAKMQADQQQNVPPVPKVGDNAVVPPAPDPKAPAPAPNMNVPAPAVAGVNPNAFKFQAAPADGALPPLPPLPDGGLRNRLLVASVQLGDFYFQAGQFAAAQQQYMAALAFDPGNWDVRQRLMNVAPLVPPPAPIGLFQPLYVKPSVAVMPFLTMGDPSYMPPALTWWTPANLSPYLTPRYNVADPNVVNWLMARAGISMNDLLTNPVARFWLARAAGVRYFVFGNHIQQASGFDVNTYLVDAELGYQQGSANINVQSTYELKLRLPQLAMLTMMTPADQAAYLLSQTPFGIALNNGLLHMNQGMYSQAVVDFGIALALWPDNVQAQLYLIRAQQLASTQTWQLAQQKQWQVQQLAATYAAARQRQLQMLQASQQASAQAATYNASLTPQQREARSNLRSAAQKQLVAQAQVAQQNKQTGVSVSLLQGAAGLTPPQAAIDQALAQARQAARQAEQARFAQFTATRESARSQRDQQLQQAKQQAMQDQMAYQASLKALGVSQSERDEKTYRELKSQGLQLLSQNKYSAALTAFQGAQRFKQSDDVRVMVDRAAEGQAIAQGKTEQDKLAIEQKLLAESQRRREIDATAKQKDALYKTALQAGQQALARKDFDTARAKFQEAGTHFKTDAVVAGLQQVDAARAPVPQQAVPQKNPAAQKQSDYQLALSAGQKALQAKDYPGAIKSAQQALQIMPNDPQAAQLLQQAQQAHDKADTAQASSKLALDAGQKAMTAKNYQAAIKAYHDALTLNPNDATIRQHLKQAQQALADAQATASYQKAMNAGDAAMSFKKYDTAVSAFKDALKWAPNDKAATQKLHAAQAASVPAKTKTAEPPAATAYDQAMQKGAAAEKNQKYADAAKAFADALKARPKDKDAQAGLNKNQYNAYVVQGQQYLDSRMWVLAQGQFDAALRIFPGDPTATKLLQKAKNMGK
jgi:hypothetical protein